MGTKKLGKDRVKTHNNVAKYLHLKIYLNSGLVKTNNEWYKYEPSPVLENENFKVLWDFSIQTDKEIPANGPDIVQTKTNSAVY